MNACLHKEASKTKTKLQMLMLRVALIEGERGIFLLRIVPESV